jgi:hypothetical protein
MAERKGKIQSCEPHQTPIPMADNDNNSNTNHSNFNPLFRQNSRSFRSKTETVGCIQQQHKQQLSQEHEPLIRRQSSLFSHLPVRSQSRLLDISRIGTTTDVKAEKHSSSEEKPNNITHASTTWLQLHNDDHEELTSQLGATQFPTMNEKLSTRSLQPSSSASSLSSFIAKDPQSCQQQRQSRSQQQQQNQSKSSLFGTVMRKLGTGLTDVLLPNGSPFTKHKRNRTQSVDDDDEGVNDGVDGGFSNVDVEATTNVSANLLTSPSGKTLLDFVNKFNSPFKFQSPQKAKRRLLDSPTHNNNARTSTTQTQQYTTSPKRRRLNMVEGHLSPGRSHSRSSLRDDDDDDVNWKEVPIVDNKRLEILDWTVRTQVRIEFHSLSPSTCDIQSHTPDNNRNNNNMLWNLMVNKEWKDALIYWEYQSKPFQQQSESTNENQELVHKSIRGKGRHVSLQNNFTIDTLKQGSTLPNATQERAILLARSLIQSVRGPIARFSRNIRRTDDMDELRNESASPILYNQKLILQWQQSLRSLYVNYAREINSSLYEGETERESAAVTIGETYFYCIGEDHVVLFRVIEAEGHTADKKTLIPSILVSSSSESCRRKLEDLGLGGIVLLNTIEERENEFLLAHIDARQRTLEATQTLMSPSVKADLEALRRARAYGESAGADVYVKVGKSTQPVAKAIPQQYKAIKLSGWENVSLFLEFYLNSFGNIHASERDMTVSSSMYPFQGQARYDTQPQPPILIGDGARASFEHASMRMLNVFPVARTARDEAEVRTTETMTSIDICGIILPGAVRRMVLAARNQLMDDPEHSIAQPSTIVSVSDGTALPYDSSRFMVLHAMRPKLLPSSLGRLKGSMIFNQGGENANEFDTIVECPSGKLLQLVVLDCAREQIAACKLQKNCS